MSGGYVISNVVKR